jgi:peptidoglycan/LPS O-acetylase OafA/YrhL
LPKRHEDHLALDGGHLVGRSEGRAFVRPAKSLSGRLSDKHLTHPKYRADIDGLRAIAVLSVVGFHAFPHLIRGGLIGVDIFFVISGFLISTIVFDSLDRKCFSFAEFYSRRIRRIFPALIVVLIASFAFGWFALLADEYKQLGKHIAAGAAFVSNFVFWNESGYFDNAAASKPLLHLWSLGVEEQFYLVWPLLLWVAWQKRFNLLIIAVLVAVISFALNAQGIGKDAVATFYSPQTRFWELMVGSMLAWLALHGGGTLPKL